jgi:hypothetical protein
VLSLLALSLPWIAALDRAATPAGRRAFAAAIGMAALVSAAWHLPSRPEQYVRPTALAQAMWSAGWVHVTPAEVFAERVQGREAPSLPLAYDNCRVVLMSDGQWPITCVPPPGGVPRSCLRAGAMCYGVSTRDTTRVIATANDGFFFTPAVPSWPADGPLARSIRAVLLDTDGSGLDWRVEPVRQWLARSQDATVETILRRDRAVFVFVPRTGPAPGFGLQAHGFTRATVRSLLPPSVLSESSAAADYFDLRLPARGSNLAISLH